jgi:hypothetical protein
MVEVVEHAHSEERLDVRRPGFAFVSLKGPDAAAELQCCAGLAEFAIFADSPWVNGLLFHAADHMADAECEQEVSS